MNIITDTYTYMSQIKKSLSVCTKCENLPFYWLGQLSSSPPLADRSRGGCRGPESPQCRRWWRWSRLRARGNASGHCSDSYRKKQLYETASTNPITMQNFFQLKDNDRTRGTGLRTLSPGEHCSGCIWARERRNFLHCLSTELSRARPATPPSFWTGKKFSKQEDHSHIWTDWSFCWDWDLFRNNNKTLDCTRKL